ncbi:MAG: hypothetical protein AAF499_03295, partial [Pseudomonadota bacterium]
MPLTRAPLLKTIAVLWVIWGAVHALAGVIVLTANTSGGIASSLDSELTKNLSTGMVKMKVEAVLKGESHVKVGQTVDATYYGKVEVGRRFLLSGVDPPNLQWSCLPVTKRAEKYIVDATKVEDDPVARLRYYRNFLEDEEALISRDAYDEFASAPYGDIRKIGEDMDHD